ncbi:MAG: 5-formyltetrahydrofolate cyclo-ligase [Bacteroides sp.]
MKEQKKLLRKVIAQQKALHTPQELAVLSAALFNKLETHPLFVKAKTILLYYSLKDEVQTAAFIEKWKESKKILLPIVVGDNLELKHYTGKLDLKVGAYGIKEPIGTAFTDYQKIDLAIIPGMSFDTRNNRLGRGKGYYDRLLPLLSAYKIGICFSFQVSDEIPEEVFDIKMDEVWTEYGSISGK